MTAQAIDKNLLKTIFPAHLVTIDPEVVSGTPVFAGTRVPVKSLFDWLETETLDEFLENFPSVQRTQAVAVLGLDGSINFKSPQKNYPHG